VNIGIELNDKAIRDFPKLKNHLIYKESALDFLTNPKRMEYTNYQVRTFVYCDPPYPHSTRGKTRYNYELSDNDHIDLLKIIKSLDCLVAISTYPNDMYSEALSNWRVVGYESVKRSGEVGKELLYMNYEKPEILHDDSYLGDNANNRQDIKRRLTRTKNRILKWDVQERLKLMREIFSQLPEHERKHLFTLAFDGNHPPTNDKPFGRYG